MIQVFFSSGVNQTYLGGMEALWELIQVRSSNLSEIWIDDGLRMWGSISDVGRLVIIFVDGRSTRATNGSTIRYEFSQYIVILGSIWSWGWFFVLFYRSSVNAHLNFNSHIDELSAFRKLTERDALHFARDWSRALRGVFNAAVRRVSVRPPCRNYIRQLMMGLI